MWNEAEVIALAFFLDEAGSFYLTKSGNPTPRISFASCDRVLVEQVASMMTVNIVQVENVFQATLGGHRAASLMRAILPYMGGERFIKIREVLTRWRGPRRRKITICRKEELIRLLNAGVPHDEIAKVYETSRSNITYIASSMRRNGVEIPASKRGNLLAQRALIEELRQKHMSYAAIAKEIGCSKASIIRILSKEPVVRVEGVEPTRPAWKAGMLP